MDATTMPSTRLTLANLQRDFPTLRFKRDSSFRWSPEQQTVYYANLSDTASFVHEIAHAQLGHTTYTRDIELLQMERDAWGRAVTIAKNYDTSIDPEYIEAMLDTYRDWLHARSTCPVCEATGIQTAAQHYMCLACSGQWKVNEARVCALRRYRLTKTAA